MFAGCAVAGRGPTPEAMRVCAGSGGELMLWVLDEAPTEVDTLREDVDVGPGDRRGWAVSSSCDGVRCSRPLACAGEAGRRFGGVLPRDVDIVELTNGGTQCRG